VVTGKSLWSHDFQAHIDEFHDGEEPLPLSSQERKGRGQRKIISDNVVSSSSSSSVESDNNNNMMLIIMGYYSNFIWIKRAS